MDDIERRLRDVEREMAVATYALKTAASDIGEIKDAQRWILRTVFVQILMTVGAVATALILRLL